MYNTNNKNLTMITIVAATMLGASTYAEELDVLVFSANTQRWAHVDAIQDGIDTIIELGDTENWNVITSVSPADFTNANLAQFDVIVFNNTGGDSLFNANQQAAFQTYIRAGGGYVGIHSASATEFDWEWYGELVGGVNEGHPVAQGATLNVAEAHPSNLHLDSSFNELGEWYYWKEGTDPREKDGMKILLSLDGNSITNTSRGGINDRAHPVAWCREFDGGRSFYTVQAHFGELYEEDYFKTFLAEGIKWAADAVEQNGLLLDLDANKSVTVEDGDKVTRWVNQAPTDVAQIFQSTDDGREVANVPIDSARGVDLLGPGSGRPTLLSNVSELNGHNSMSFIEEDLINLEENAFDHLSHGNGYTWVAVLSRYKQRWPGEKIKDVNAFFGNLRNGSPFDGMWGGFDSQNRIWASTRTRDASVRDTTGDDWIIGPVLPEKEYFIAAGRLGEGQGTVTMELFTNSADPIDSVPVKINPNGNPSFMAIGTERFATNHPGKESFDGEIARFLIYERPLTNLELEQTIETLRLKYLAEENNTVSNSLVFDFESGDLQGATISEGSFGEIITDKATFNTTGEAYNKQGTYFLSTLEGQGRDSYTGTIVSPSFLLTGAEISFLIGGGMSADLSFSIHEAQTGTELFSTNRGSNAEPLERRTANLAAHIGKTLYWQVTDNSTGGWGYIAVDNIQVDGVLVSSNNFESGTLDNLFVSGNFPALIQDRDNYIVPRNYDTPFINKEGTYFLSTLDNGNGGVSNSYTGEITSNYFVINNPNASLLISGGSDTSRLGFVIYDESDQEIIRVANSRNSEAFERVNLDLTDHIGKTVYWVVEDYSTLSWGYIAVDDIQFGNSSSINSLTNQDIGNVALAGSYTANTDGSLTMTASGADIWGQNDAFQFASSSISGDGEIIALVDSVENTHRWAKGGVMMRNSFATNSQNVFVFVAPDGKVTMQARASLNGRSTNLTTNKSVGSGGTPKYVSLIRSGNTFIGSYSVDGQTWVEINRINVSMGEDILAGLAATSHNNNALTTVEFNRVIIDDE